MSNERWTLNELSKRIESALAVDYVPGPSARVRAVPDRRTIRYYTTLGLVDRPVEMRGRTALYGRRHLLQLVAIKRLQAAGLTLGRVQEQLAGLDDPSLERLARVPDTAPAPAQPTAPTPAPAEAAFWEALPPPAPLVPTQALEERAPTHKAEVMSRARQASPGQPRPVSLTGLTLAEETTLLFPGVRALNADDAAALRQAAEPLLRLLRERGIA